MKYIIFSIIIAILLFIIYSHIIQSLSLELFKNPDTFSLKNRSKAPISGITAKMGIGDKVDVIVIRNRWYGKITELHGKETTYSTLKLFGLVSLPLQINNSNWAKYHFIAGFVSIIIILFGFITDNIHKGGYSYEERNKII